MSLQLPENVRQELIKSVPLSTIELITCFVFYDNHPRDEKCLDVIVCTTGGKIVEYYKREVVCSLKLNTTTTASEIKILRNDNCDLFYMVVVGDEILIISRKQNLDVHRRVSNVDKYYIEDQSCRGQACLKVICKDDAVPIVFDENFDDLGRRAMLLSGLNADDTLPILTQLMRKLTEAKFSVKCNEKTLNELLSLRQMSALSSYQQVYPNSRESIFQGNSKEVPTDNTLDIKTKTPWVKLCNNRIVIMLTLCYTSDEPLEDIHILLHGTDKPSITYTTRLFEKIETPPFWREKRTRVIKNDHEIAVTAVVNLGEIKNVTTKIIEFNGAMFYKKSGKEYLLPMEHVSISGDDIMGKEYDALMCSDLDEMTCLAIVASTSSIQMVFRHIRKNDDLPIVMSEIFCTHLHMNMLRNTNNVIIYRNSPYHALNGVMLVFDKNNENGDIYNVSVYTRSPSQILTLMYYVHTTIPYQIVITTTSQRIMARKDELARYNEAQVLELSNLNYQAYGSSIVNQCNMLLEYFDTCMMKMGSSGDTDVAGKIGTVIDMFAPGLTVYNEFRENILNEASKGIKSYIDSENGSERMII
ncbi:unnamed protein product [Diatraea saccharalis]|uniref:Uncharacterized protein n=1 Tax=Diatraea saccharalis TaxID=40085 RepID=A0A9N9RDR4_9NEOP|nr:unnamed protein product [Diatraea saccharalis]